MKYVDAVITFREVPEEVSLCISISGCKIHCKGCHSKYLWGDIGTPLTCDELVLLIDRNSGISCVCFMGGDIDALDSLFSLVHTLYPTLKIAWYTGESNIPLDNPTIKHLDYIKIGPYKEECGGLDNPNTNQRLYQKDKNGEFIDITYKFWK